MSVNAETEHFVYTEYFLPDVAELVERLHQIGLHHGVAEPSDVDHRGRGDTVTVLRNLLQREEGRDDEDRNTPENTCVLVLQSRHGHRHFGGRGAGAQTETKGHQNDS